ncbi:hypothetical protein BH23THE1_BH23THE1_34110 [soil metagenome]
MDFTKLTLPELSEFFSMYSVIPSGDPYQYASSLFNQVGSQGRFPESVVDLYVATQLKDRVNVPSNYDVYSLTPSQFLELARIFHLPLEDTPNIRNRAKRIIRILHPSVKVVPISYQGPGQPGDFGWMIRQPEYQDVLFLFNDNQEQFVAFLDYLRNSSNFSNACSAGDGNAIIRPYQCENPPKSAGIPTGSRGQGYQNLVEAKPYIDAAFDRIKQLVNTGRYQRMMYSATRSGNLGTAIFSPSEEVKSYIVNRIRDLAA